MAKTYNPIFTINIANIPKKTFIKSIKSISRKCFAVVIKENNEYKAAIDIDEKQVPIKFRNQFNNFKLIIPFTTESLNLKDKTHVFSKYKDEQGKYAITIRTEEQCHNFPGINTQYDALKENNLIAGYIVRENNKMYFDYKYLIKYHYSFNAKICDIEIDNTKPLFNK